MRENKCETEKRKMIEKEREREQNGVYENIVKVTEKQRR